MIRLTKSGIPKVLELNAAKWTEIVLEKIRDSIELAKAEKSRYNHADIKEAIVAETSGKCAYCESMVRHVTYGDIEHITPKTSSPELWFEWSNLTLACDVCNTKKGDDVEMIDPYSTDPEQRLVFFGAMVWPVPGDEQADLTIRALDLNRSELIGKRKERIEYLMALKNSAAKTKDEALRRLLQEDFNFELADQKEYAALSRAVSRELAAKEGPF